MNFILNSFWRWLLFKYVAFPFFQCHFLTIHYIEDLNRFFFFNISVKFILTWCMKKLTGKILWYNRKWFLSRIERKKEWKKIGFSSFSLLLYWKYIFFFFINVNVHAGLKYVRKKCNLFRKNFFCDFVFSGQVFIDEKSNICMERNKFWIHLIF